MKTRIIITLTALLMLAGISSNAQSGNLNPSTSPIIGDLNNDNKVDAADVVALVNLINDLYKYDYVVANQIQLIPTYGSPFAKADTNLDGSVNAADIDALVKQVMDETKFALVDLRNDTEYADALLLSNKGYYALFDGDNEKGYIVIHINEVSKDISDGITFFVDENGNPVMASTSEGHIIFRNVTDNSFDFAFVDNQNNVSYIEDIAYDSQLPIYRSNTRGFISLYTDAFTGGWDEHSKKVLIPFLLKTVGFGIIAVATVTAVTAGSPLLAIGAVAGLLCTAASEFTKSFYEDYKNVSTYLDRASLGLGLVGEWNPQNIVQSILSYLFGHIGDQYMNHIDETTPYIDPLYTSDEWEINLSTYSLECPPEGGYYTVNVESKAIWEIDCSQLDMRWCQVREINRDDNKFVVYVDKYDGIYDRTCDLYVYISNSNKNKIKRLSIKQSGYKFDISPEEIVFTYSHLMDEICVKDSFNVSSYEITQRPDWCNYKKIKNTFSVYVNPSDVDVLYDREGEIIVTAYINGGGWIDKKIKVRQEGSKYKLSSKEIVFTPAHRSETIYPNSYPVTYEISCPEDWCKVTPSDVLSITVDKSLYEERECEIKVTASFEYGKAKIERTIKVKQLPLCPDENHPHMIDLGLPSGTKWSCCNAGASSPDKMGNYYSWGNHSPLSYTTGTYFDKDYPYKEWRDLDHDGKPSSTWDEWFIKLDEAYNSATSGSWGNGSMPSRDDCKELIENCERNQYIGTLGNQYGYYYTSKVNNNCIFIPYKSELYYWIYSTENNWAGIFNPSSGGSGGSLGDPEIISGNDRAKYCTGRPVRPVSK